MNKRWRQLFSLILCLILVFTLAGCSNQDGDGKGSFEGEETFIFTDSTGRRVELPRHITRVASGGPLANIILYSLKPEVLVGWSSSPPPTSKKYMAAAYQELPEYGRFYGDAGDFNREALMASEPEVIIDVGEWDEDYKLELDSLQEQLGIPVILLGGNLEENASTYRT
ncbi:MAG: peptide ABC transporter substrate-binding protein, partial [Firmicutes bacterium]|nr:peptide ABC transporter substrate-binding protein [Bacillota bacterium]